MKTFKKLTKKEKLEYVGIMAIYPLILLYGTLGKSFKFLNSRSRQITASILTACLIFTMIPVMGLTVFAAGDSKEDPIIVTTFEEFEDAFGNEYKTYYIQLGADITATNSVSITDNTEYFGKHPFNLDLNGYTLTFEKSGGLFSQNYSFEIGVDATIENGYIVAEGSPFDEDSNGKINLKNVEITSNTDCALQGDELTVNAENCYFKTNATGKNAVYATVSGGLFSPNNKSNFTLTKCKIESQGTTPAYSNEGSQYGLLNPQTYYGTLMIDSESVQNAYITNVYDGGYDISWKHNYHYDNKSLEHNDTHHWYKCLVTDCPVCAKNDVTLKIGYAAHSYTYAADDLNNVITQSCTHSCGFNATATLTAPNSNLVYNGYEHNAAVAFSTNWQGEKPQITYTLNGNAVTDTKNAGEYVAKIKSGDAEVSVSYTIAKADDVVKITDNISKTYDGETVGKPKYKVTGKGNVTVEYKLATADDTAYSTNAPKAAGTYKVRVSTDESDSNYKAASAETEFTISQKEAALEWTAPASLVYDRTAKIPTAKVTNLVKDDTADIEVDLNTGNNINVTDAGFTFRVIALNNNYKLPENVVSGVYKIAPKEIGLQWTASENMVYNAEAKVITAKATDVEDGDTVNVTVALSENKDNVNVGKFTYTATSIIGNANYKLPSNTVSQEFEITPRPLQNTDFNVDITDKAYNNGNEIKPTVFVKSDNLITKKDYSVVYKDNTVVGTATVEITGINNAKGTVSFNFAITKVNPSPNWPDDIQIGTVINGEKATLNDVELPEDFEWDDKDTQIAYGSKEYSATYEPADTHNYNTVKNNITVNGLDVTFPTGEITLKENKWNEFLNNITFGLFFKETQSVTVTAADTESGVKEIAYYLAAEELSADDVKALENSKWTVYEDAFNVEPDNKYVVYARITDNVGNVIYINSDGIVLDSIKPVIAGVEDGKDVYGDATFTVDETYLDTVTLDGKPIEVKDGKYSVPADNKEHTIVVTDKTGNAVTYKLTVYKNYKVSFVVDGKEIELSEVGYGKDATLPEIPQKDGYTAKWDVDGKNITADTVITAVYTEIPQSPQTGDNSNIWFWFAVLFVSGCFLVALGFWKKKQFFKR